MDGLNNQKVIQKPLETRLNLPLHVSHDHPDELDEGDYEGPEGDGSEVVPDEVLEADQNGELEEGLLPGEVPGGDGAGDGDVLAGDDELGDPEAAEDVVQPHPGEERICGIVNV